MSNSEKKHKAKPESADLRARVWILVCFVVMYALITIHPGLRHSQYFSVIKGSASAIFGIVIGLNIIITAYAVWALIRAGNNYGSIFGKNRHLRASVEDALLGISLGILLLAVSIFLSSMFRGSHKGTGDDLAITVSDHVIEVTMYIVVSICEEVQFRGYVLEAIRDITRNKAAAAILQAVLFTLMHGTRQRLADYAIRFVFGLGFGLIAIYRKSILPAVAAHLTINMAAFISGLV